MSRNRYDDDDYYGWAPYVPVAERRANAQREMQKLRKQGVTIQPVELAGARTIAKTFWGKGWCDHLESFSDYENRLPRGRTYVRNGSVCHLDIQAGRIEAYVSGSELYKVRISIEPLAKKLWKTVKDQCRGQIGSLLELLQGRLSDSVMRVVIDRNEGLFPKPKEIKLFCSCPDYASMCKHVSAVLYGVGSRLDERPELLFILRGVKAEELIAASPAVPAAASAGTADSGLAAGSLSEIFGIDLDEEAVPAVGHKKKSIASVGRKRTSAPAAAMAKPPAGKSSSGKRASGASGSGAAKSGMKVSAKTGMKVSDKTGMKVSDKAAVKTTAKSVVKAAAKTVGKALAKAAAKALPNPARSTAVFDPAAPTGAAVARLRQEAGLSVAAFARALKVSPETVRRWESESGSLRIQFRQLTALKKFGQRKAI